MSEQPPIRITHLGNTANNAFHNVRLLHEYAGIEASLPIQMFTVTHAMSAPAWDVAEFVAPNAAWVAAPDWSIHSSAAAINADFSDLPVAEAHVHSAQPVELSEPPAQERLTLKQQVGRTIAKTPLYPYLNEALVRRSLHPVSSRSTTELTLLYGPDSLSQLSVGRRDRGLISLEHGTVRWIADGAADGRFARKRYAQQLRNTEHLWITNLDERTFEIAEDVVPGRWSALPHPFMFDERVPFETNAANRASLLQTTNSEALVLVASSQNWSKHHDKGSRKALEAFVALRLAGEPVGLIAVEWGLQLEESKQFLREAGVDEHVHWIAPLPRIPLQQLMADVDVVWDQFGLDAFGALALRTLEQGTPLVSRGLTEVGASMIGSQVPWLLATEIEEIQRRTSDVINHIQRRGREVVMQEFRTNARSWLERYHSPRITAQLQSEVYNAVVSGDWHRGASLPDAWARLVNTSLATDAAPTN